nr:immunoglobulin heavy chain junction region [Macaca mulatta]
CMRGPVVSATSVDDGWDSW